MKRIIAGASFVLLLPVGAFGQAAAAKPEFEVADVKQNKSGDTQVQGGMLPGGNFPTRNAPLKLLLGFAFDVPNLRFLDSFITGEPQSVDSDRFDIVGKATPDMPPRQCFFSRFCLPDKTLGIMLQGFLEKEFKIVSHREPQPMDVYALVAGKGALKFQKAAGAGERNCRRIFFGNDDPDSKTLSAGQGGFICANMTMTDLAQLLPEMAGAYIDRPVVDLTGLQGTYDFKMVWTSKASLDDGGITVFDAMNNLGLKLDGRKVPVPIVVIDHIEKLAGDN